ncbi:hypothetical protein [Curtobacterium sp. UCD-KPL2560]|uniref:hypothetical protein n=1 Tax=Curtobacterium sp. UCD-KPL2560 TaxID=1885315 RepID=UPI00209B9BE3|nr:hypothetical protein [Curtobacterium sp. UCD-KPL2560]
MRLLQRAAERRRRSGDVHRDVRGGVEVAQHDRGDGSAVRDAEADELRHRRGRRRQVGYDPVRSLEPVRERADLCGELLEAHRSVRVRQSEEPVHPLGVSERRGEHPPRGHVTSDGGQPVEVRHLHLGPQREYCDVLGGEPEVRPGRRDLRRGQGRLQQPPCRRGEGRHSGDVERDVGDRSSSGGFERVGDPRRPPGVLGVLVEVRTETARQRRCLDGDPPAPVTEARPRVPDADEVLFRHTVLRLGRGGEPAQPFRIGTAAPGRLRAGPSSVPSTEGRGDGRRSDRGRGRFRVEGCCARIEQGLPRGSDADQGVLAVSCPLPPGRELRPSVALL